MELRRLTAKKAFIGELVKGIFVPREGLESSYVLTRLGRRISRVRIIGNVVDVYENPSSSYLSLALDDGTGVIRVKAFDARELMGKIRHGELVEIFGKVKMQDGETWIAAEIIRKISDPNVEILRKLEIAKILSEQAKKVEKIKNILPQTSDIDELFSLLGEEIPKSEIKAIVEAIEKFSEQGDEGKRKIMKLIEELDYGDGANYEEIVRESGMSEDEVEAIIKSLLESGECFEPRPGKIKKVM